MVSKRKRFPSSDVERLPGGIAAECTANTAKSTKNHVMPAQTTPQQSELHQMVEPADVPQKEEDEEVGAIRRHTLTRDGSQGA